MAAGVRYNVVSWFNEALDENSDTVQKIEDSASVGDGFDPQILRGSTSFRTSDLFQAAPYVSLTANAVRQEGDRWIYTFPDNPRHTLTGPAAPVSELTALYDIFKKRSHFLLELAKEEYVSSRVRNLDTPELGKRWQNAMALYRVTGDKDYLEFAMRDADRYIKERVNQPARDFKDPEGGQMFFWAEINPRFKLLFEMYEIHHPDRHRYGAFQFPVRNHRRTSS